MLKLEKNLDICLKRVHYTSSVKFLHDTGNEAIHAIIAIILPDFSFQFCKLL